MQMSIKLNYFPTYQNKTTIYVVRLHFTLCFTQEGNSTNTVSLKTLNIILHTFLEIYKMIQTILFFSLIIRLSRVCVTSPSISIAMMNYPVTIDVKGLIQRTLSFFQCPIAALDALSLANK